MAPTPSDDGVERILVVVAHPDDCDFGCAGTVARWTAAGIEVSYVICTDGQAGGSDRSIDRAHVGPLRRREQTAAAAECGVTDLTFLGYMDGELTPSLELRREISRVIRQKRPQRVVCQSPERNYARIHASHPDHRAAGEAALCAVYPEARNPFAYMELLHEGLEPHIVPEVWLTAHPRSEHYSDITATMDRKLAALRRHESQYDDWDALAERLRSWGAENARRGGLPEGSYAEIFAVIDTA